MPAIATPDDDSGSEEEDEDQPEDQPTTMVKAQSEVATLGNSDGWLGGWRPRPETRQAFGSRPSSRGSSSTAAPPMANTQRMPMRRGGVCGSLVGSLNKLAAEKKGPSQKTLEERAKEAFRLQHLQDSKCKHRGARANMRDLLYLWGQGSVLRGWRSELDPDGLTEVSFPNLCQAAARIAFTDDVLLLYGKDADLKPLTLDELIPELSPVFERFRTWVKSEHDGPFGFFDFCVRMCPPAPGTPAGQPVDLRKACLTWGGFNRGLRSALAEKVHGFQCTDAEARELFGICDPFDARELTRDDVVFLEMDPQVRDYELYKIKTRYRDQNVRLLTDFYSSERERQVPSWHRLAPRAWNASHFETLPTVMCVLREEGSHRTLRLEKQAFEQFLAELRTLHGNEVRAWRRGLDPDGTFELTKKQLKRYCRQVNSRVDICALWRHVDRDSDGSVDIEELISFSVTHLASFRRWAHHRVGSCEALWQLREMQEARCNGASKRGHWASDKKMLLAAFGTALKGLGWPSPEIGQADAHKARQVVLQSLDLHGCGFVAPSDLEWLDRWKPAEWMWASPDPEAWAELKALFVKTCDHALAAWRKLLDLDDSNSISWVEFKEAAEKVKWKGNVGGAWRHLDADLSGFVSMREYDVKSADLLASFKDWVDTNFGSVRLAFKALDGDGNNSISLSELRKACSGLRWQGDPRELFNCLDKDGQRDKSGDNAGKRSLSLAELIFLDNWKTEPVEEDLASLELPDSAGSDLRQSHRRPHTPEVSSDGAKHGHRRGTHRSGASSPPTMVTGIDNTTATCGNAMLRQSIGPVGPQRKSHLAHSRPGSQGSCGGDPRICGKTNAVRQRVSVSPSSGGRPLPAPGGLLRENSRIKARPSSRFSGFQEDAHRQSSPAFPPPSSGSSTRPGSTCGSRPLSRCTLSGGL